MVLKPHYDKEFLALAGKTIERVVHMDASMIEDMAWYGDPEDTTMLVFTDKSVAIISADPEGNGPGFMFFGDLVTK